MSKRFHNKSHRSSERPVNLVPSLALPPSFFESQARLQSRNSIKSTGPDARILKTKGSSGKRRDKLSSFYHDARLFMIMIG